LRLEQRGGSLFASKPGLFVASADEQSVADGDLVFRNASATGRNEIGQFQAAVNIRLILTRTRDVRDVLRFAEFQKRLDRIGFSFVIYAACEPYLSRRCTWWLVANTLVAHFAVSNLARFCRYANVDA
jgi:hypothetical protein